MERNQAVVLLSDGMNTVFKRDFTALCRQLGQRPVPIYVIGIGWDLHEYDANSGNTAYSLLENLAQQTGGQFYFSPYSQQLAVLYEQVAADVRGKTRYRLQAQWEVSDRTMELASVARPPAAVRGPAYPPLPPASLQLAPADRGRMSRGPQLVTMPAAAVQLAPLVAARRSAGPVVARLPSMQQLELAALPGAIPFTGPRAIPLLDVIELSVNYTAPTQEIRRCRLLCCRRLN